MPLIQLGLEHTDSIAALLETSWRTQFGTGTYPVFSRPSLDWVYGGLYASDNVLLGYETGGRLTGFRAMLYRQVAVHGKTTRAHISTHLGVDPELPLAERIAAVTALGDVDSYVHPSSGVDTSTNGHLDTLANPGVERVKIRFQPAIVNARRVRACVQRYATLCPRSSPRRHRTRMRSQRCLPRKATTVTSS